MTITGKLTKEQIIKIISNLADSAHREAYMKPTNYTTGFQNGKEDAFRECIKILEENLF